MTINAAAAKTPKFNSFTKKSTPLRIGIAFKIDNGIIIKIKGINMTKLNAATEILTEGEPSLRSVID
ncbi:hypothetical protein SAMN04489708_1221 [Paracidovorax cattleyae]|uniref:Uncharacterized protein n=1 Tax=Paracidovorax cattleyae TaxID=80868 RepID=A0A1H0UV95_9BURK|nr:hypothetical protein SAMN04489708_1221 [Paracidovorax cattleyae]